MKKTMRKIAAFLICGATLTSLLAMPHAAHAAATLYDDDWTDIAKVPDMVGCNGAQGLGVGDTYLYHIQIISDNTKASIVRVNKHTGKLALMKNADTGKNYFTNFVHANDVDILTVDGKETMYVMAGNQVLAYEIDGEYMSLKATYSVMWQGKAFGPGCMTVWKTEGDTITFLFKSGKSVSYGEIGADAAEGEIHVTFMGYLDVSRIDVDGKTRNFSGFANQGMDYHDGILFITLAGCYEIETVYQSVILGYDITDMKGTIRPKEEYIFYMESEDYPRCFEIEDCGISSDGKLYFNTNRWVNLSDRNNDGIHVMNGFYFSPPLYGDVSGDGKLSIADVTAIRLYAQGCYPIPDGGVEIMDVNGDGTANVSDAMYLLVYIAGGMEKLPVEE